MAQSELKGINSVEGVEGILYQVSFLPWHSVKDAGHLHVVQQKTGPKICLQICHSIMLVSGRFKGPSHKPAEGRVFAWFHFGQYTCSPRPHRPIINHEL